MYQAPNLLYYSHWGHFVQTPQILWGFKDNNSHALVVSCVLCFTQVCINRPVLAWLSLFSLNVRQSKARCAPLLDAAMTFVAFLASCRSFSPPGSLLPITYPSPGRLGVRAPSGNLLQQLLKRWGGRVYGHQSCLFVQGFGYISWL